jgi:ribonucleoside-diphosphate reductase subunit M1
MFFGKYECTDDTDYHWLYLQGLKTGMYYLRSQAAADAIQFTVDSSKIKVMVSILIN